MLLKKLDLTFRTVAVLDLAPLALERPSVELGTKKSRASLTRTKSVKDLFLLALPALLLTVKSQFTWKTSYTRNNELSIASDCLKIS
mmetsp:Transcript_28179/g.41624  ORF Transcript_28179/g.41624 Transcript_28179/m.41624 type:complete len:87 (+) Transcript_28179:279-539(+)